METANEVNIENNEGKLVENEKFSKIWEVPTVLSLLLFANYIV